MITLRNCVGGLTTLLAGLVWFGGAASGRAADNPGAQIINIDFNGAQNNEGPRGPGPTYVGLGAAGGGSVWNGILVDSRLPDGLDDHNLTVSGENLTDSL
ncbi:MAG TPA: hypothetical protein PK640_21185, partial [Verrucomicrobiota bacterium]|nr:hypothetical protein [Verrucomicrobiota bacterium]